MHAAPREINDDCQLWRMWARAGGTEGGGRGEAGSAILGARAVALSLVGLNADLAALR